MRWNVVAIILAAAVALAAVLAGQARAQTPKPGYSLSGTDCLADISPIAEGEESSAVNSVECTIRPEEVVIPDDESNRHCVATIMPLDQGATASKWRDVSCFATFAEAISHATGGTGVVERVVTPEGVTQEILKDQPSNLNTVIGIWWEHPQFSTSNGGQTWTWSTTDARVCNGASYGNTTMPSGWNDIVSSAKAYSNCTDFENYQNASYGGLRIDCTQDCPAMGAMNDQTSSWRIDNVIP